MDGFIITLVTTALFFLGMCNPVWIIRGILLALILLYASVQDISYREADDFLWVMILLLAVGNLGSMPLWSMLLAGLTVFIPQIAIAVFSKNGGIGGADIKLSTAIAILLGFVPGVTGYVIGLLLAVLFVLVYNKLSGKADIRAFPLIPFLSVGAIIGYLI